MMAENAVAEPATSEPAMAERECGGGFKATSLQKAAASGDANMVVTALECTATNIDAINHEAQTALMIAAARGHIAVVRALCEAGADTSVEDGTGRKAEQIAREAGHEQTASMLNSWDAKRNEIEASIRAMQGLPPDPALAAGRLPKANAHVDVMAKLLAEAGVRKGPAECPF